jgi:hypothetical protein
MKIAAAAVAGLGAYNVRPLWTASVNAATERRREASSRGPNHLALQIIRAEPIQGRNRLLKKPNEASLSL